MSETTDSTAGGRVRHDHAEPIIGCRCAERAALASGLTPEQDERMAEFFGSQIVHKTPAGQDVGGASDGLSKDVEALSDLIYEVANGTCRDFAVTIMESDWLVGREAAAATRARRGERDRIARSIEAEARACNQGADWRWGLERAARIARETR